MSRSLRKGEHLFGRWTEIVDVKNRESEFFWNWVVDFVVAHVDFVVALVDFDVAHSGCVVAHVDLVFAHDFVLARVDHVDGGNGCVVAADSESLEAVVDDGESAEVECRQVEREG